MTYWLNVFTLNTWQEFKKAGASVSGFPDRRWTTVQRIEIEDILLCYMKGYSRWFGALKVISRAFRDDSTRIWSDASYPCRVRVQPLITLEPEKGIDAKEMLQELRLFADTHDLKRWSWPLRGSPRQLAKEDGDLILNKLEMLEGKKTEEERKGRKGQSYHDRIRDMLYEIGQMEYKVAKKEYPIDGERIDVVWKRIEGGNPYSVFEVQIGGNFYEALAKLKHAWDKWNSRPFLVTSAQYKEKALVWISGSFHEMQTEITIVDCEKVEELYEAVKKAKDIKTDFGII